MARHITGRAIATLTLAKETAAGSGTYATAGAGFYDLLTSNKNLASMDFTLTRNLREIELVGYDGIFRDDGKIDLTGTLEWVFEPGVHGALMSDAVADEVRYQLTANFGKTTTGSPQAQIQAQVALGEVTVTRGSDDSFTASTPFSLSDGERPLITIGTAA